MKPLTLLPALLLAVAASSWGQTVQYSKINVMHPDGGGMPPPVQSGGPAANANASASPAPQSPAALMAATAPLGGYPDSVTAVAYAQNSAASPGSNTAPGSVPAAVASPIAVSLDAAYTPVQPTPQSAPVKPRYIYTPIPLNQFILLMAKQGGMTYIPDPDVKGEVSGVFYTSDPVSLIQRAAIANGYTAMFRNGGIELMNSELLKHRPVVQYTHKLIYLRAPYVRDPGLAEPNTSVFGSSTSSIGSGSGTGGIVSSGTSGSSGIGSSGSGQGGGGSTDGAPSTVPGSQEQRIKALFEPLMSHTPGVSYLDYDIKKGMLIAQDYDYVIDSLDSFVKKLDVPEPTISVEVMAFDVENNPSYYRGVDWSSTLGSGGVGMSVSMKQTLVDIFTGGATVKTDITNMLNNGQFVFTPDQIAWTLRFLNVQQKILGKARWQVVGESNESMVSKVVSSQPIITVSQSTVDIAGSTQVNYIDVGAILRVTAQRLEKNLVRLEVSPELSEITGNVTSGGVTAPVIDRRQSQSIITVPFGCAGVLSGLESIFYTYNDNKVPILGDIPGLKYFFSSKQRTAANRNLVVVVIPREIDPYNVADVDAHTKSVLDAYRETGWEESASLDNTKSTTDSKIDAEVKSEAPAVTPLTGKPKDVDDFIKNPSG